MTARPVRTVQVVQLLLVALEGTIDSFNNKLNSRIRVYFIRADKQECKIHSRFHSHFTIISPNTRFPVDTTNFTNRFL